VSDPRHQPACPTAPKQQHVGAATGIPAYSALGAGDLDDGDYYPGSPYNRDPAAGLSGGLQPRGGGGGGMKRAGASKSYRWLEDAITEWADSQTHVDQPAPGQGGYTRKQVEEVKMVLRLLPIFWTTVIYW
jgi:hypothetical protein